MMDDFSLAALYAVWLALSTMPLGFMLGSSCSPCCGSVGCGIADGKPRTDPATEGVWTPSGTWRGVGGVTWTYSATPSTTDGGTWFFYGSASTSKVGGGASTAEQEDWGNICNWYSNKTDTPSSTSNITTVLDKRATSLPPSDAIVHVYSTVSTATTGPVTVKNIYFWGGTFAESSELTATASAHDSAGGTVVWFFENKGTINGGATFNGSTNVNFRPRNGSTGVVNGGATFMTKAFNQGGGTINGGALFYDESANDGTVNGGAEFRNSSRNSPTGVVNGGAEFFNSSANAGADSFGNPRGVVNDGAVFWDSCTNTGTINDGAEFNDFSANLYVTANIFGRVNGGATFYDDTGNTGEVNDGAFFYDLSGNGPSIGSGTGTVNGLAVFYGSSTNYLPGTAEDGAEFYDTSLNNGVVNNGATFNDNSRNGANSFGVPGGTVNGGATFNDDACSSRVADFTSFANCPSGALRRRFVAHPTDIPTCNGTAPGGCDNAADTCGCN